MSICRLGLSVALVLGALAGQAAHASFVPDAQGDFLPTYTGVHAGDLDVLFAYGVFNEPAQTFTFGATMSSPIGTTAGVLYVWGIDRGTGTERFLSGSPSIGAGVFFDSVIVVNGSTGSAQVNLLNGQPAMQLPTGAVVISGNSITTTLDASKLPSTGRAFGAYGWNLWPRLGTGQNSQISDFAPDASTPPVVTVVPEPATAALLMAGAAVVLVRRRRSA